MQNLVSMVQKWLRQQDDLNNLATAEGPALADIGLSRAEALDLAAAPLSTHRRMVTMAQAYGLSEQDIAHEHWRNVDMARTCAHCDVRSECKAWMEGDDRRAEDAGFCPNTAQFMELAADGV